MKTTRACSRSFVSINAGNSSKQCDVIVSATHREAAAERNRDGGPNDRADDAARHVRKRVVVRAVMEVASVEPRILDELDDELCGANERHRKHKREPLRQPKPPRPRDEEHDRGRDRAHYEVL